jgi:hypothetical protein
MNKFNIGDKVLIIGKNTPGCINDIGDKGTVVATQWHSIYGNIYQVNCGKNLSRSWSYERDLKKIFFQINKQITLL